MIGQVILITGASSGIGYAAALAFARRGDHVAALARRVERLAALEQAVHALPTPHGDLLPLAADVRDSAAVQAAVAQTIDRFGRLDVLIANAGLGHRGPLVDAEWQDIDTLLRTNLDGVLHSIRAAVPVMRGGHIVMISSVVATMTAPYTALYAASKAFVSSLARSLRLELAGDGITVTDMLVGRTATEFNDKRLGKGQRASSKLVRSMSAEQVAEAIVRACDRRSRRVILRPIDRLILLGNLLAPGLIGRLVVKQYK